MSGVGKRGGLKEMEAVFHTCVRLCPGSSLPAMEVRSITKLAYYCNIWKLRFREPIWSQENDKSDNPFFNVLHICVQPFCLKHWIQQQA